MYYKGYIHIMKDSKYPLIKVLVLQIEKY